jgi:hypothetical protein
MDTPPSIRTESFATRPLSFAPSKVLNSNTAAMMSFDFSGDFLAVIQLANKIWKDFDGAPSQFNDIAASYVIHGSPTGKEANVDTQ